MGEESQGEEKGGGVANVHRHASLHHWSLVITTHRKNVNRPESVTAGA